MITTNHFNILLYMKCGTHYLIGIFDGAKAELGSVYGGATDLKIIVNHIPASQIPFNTRHKPTAVVCRNVFDWYVSRYFFMEDARIKGNGIFHKTETRYLLPTIWEKYCAYGLSISGFRKHLPYAIEHCPLGENYFEFIKDAKDICFLKFENISNELWRFLIAVSPPEVFIPLQKKIEAQPITNATPNRPLTADCYTTKNIDLIYHAEFEYISRFGQDYTYKTKNK